MNVPTLICILCTQQPQVVGPVVLHEHLSDTQIVTHYGTWVNWSYKPGLLLTVEYYPDLIFKNGFEVVPVTSGKPGDHDCGNLPCP